MTEWTLNQILHIQKKQLADWKLRLNTQCFAILESEVKSQNSGLTAKSKPDSVFRGNAMDVFIKSIPQGLLREFKD